MIVQRDAARLLIERCKQAGLTVVAEGPLFVGEHEQFPAVDHFVLNEAEITLPPFLADLAAGHPQRVYATAEFPDLRQSPMPVWPLADWRLYDAVSIQFSRGCPFNCDFCNITALIGHKPRTKTALQVIAELDSLHSAGWRGNVLFVDDNFIGNKRILKTEVLPALIAWRKGKTGLAFSTELSINLADDPELLGLMVEASFTTVFVGIETPSDAGLSECSKIQNRGRDLVESVKRLQCAGLPVQGGFIVGFDSDSPSIFQQQVDFIQMSGIVIAMVGLLKAPYGTRLYERMQREGRLTSQMTGDNADGSTNIIPEMGLEPLRQGYRWLLGQIYSPQLYYARVKTFLLEYRAPKVSPRLEAEHVRAFFRSVYELGIRGTERVHYWELLFWALFRRPKLFPLAVTLAIYGFHCRLVTELNVQ